MAGEHKAPTTSVSMNGEGKQNSAMSMNGGGKPTTSSTVCVTGGSGFIGSWLVKRLLQKGYYVRATVRVLGDENKVRNLLELPNAETHLSLWKADLLEDGSFDDVIQGCQGVFHVANPPDIMSSKDPENETIKPIVNGVLNIMRSCSKAKTVERFVFTSSMATITVGPQPPPEEYNESLWTDIEFCRLHKMPGWPYFVGKTTAEKAAWSYAEENGLDVVTVQPCFVIGPLITPFKSLSIELATALYAKNEALYPMLKPMDAAVHVVDVCDAHIYLFENPLAKGRYICASHSFNLFELAKSLGLKYPDSNIQIEEIKNKFEGFDESAEVIPCSSKKLMDLGFQFAYKDYTIGELCAEAIESCKEKGLL